MSQAAPRAWWRSLLSVLGVRPHPEPPGGVRLTLRFFVLVGVAVALVALGGLVRYSESPTFCHSCHIMEPYYQAWKASKHNKVPCVECHYAPSPAKVHLWHKFQALSQVVKYVTRTYSSKPYAEVDDAACMRSGCHATRLLQGRIVTRTGINFDHRPHLTQRRRGRQLRCVSCHSQVMVGRHIEVTYDTCILCHFLGQGEGRNIHPIGGCTGCHNLPTQDFKLGNMTYNHRAFVLQRGVACTDCHSDVLGGTGQVQQDRCFTCHNQPEKIAKFNDIPFIHDNHVTKHHVACFYCHEPMRHGGGGGVSSASAPLPQLGLPAAVAGAADTSRAAAGHPPTLAFECGLCHESKHLGQREMYTGEAGTLGLPRMPSPMYLANVDCIGCHYQSKGDSSDVEFRGRNWRASEEACVKCHGPKFRGVMQETRTEFRDGLAGLDQKLAAARTALAKAGAASPERSRLAARVQRADRWVRFVRVARGDHNVYLASLALRRADQELNEVGTALEASLPDLSASPLISGSFCATLCHAKVGVKVPPVTVQAFGKTMPHKMHTEQLGCVKCHDIGAHKRVPLRRDIKAVCAECHS
ncbi:MAG TPA: cytochrome c3 family protein [Candidatus Saccharimonadales bacterium]|nr:cytochrome c3 family protein [Candidatus Saccharimonadales bacterium]